MPIVNYIYNMLKGSVAKHIVDLPDISDDKKKEIAEAAAQFVLDLVNEAAEGVGEGLVRGLKDEDA